MNETPDVPDRTGALTPAGLRTPRAAGIAGIAFSLLLGTALVLIRLAVPSDPNDAGVWLTEERNRAAVRLALALVPFAGIAFLWFVGVVRDRIGRFEDRFFSTVLLGSGLLFVAMLFVAAAVSAAVLADPGVASGRMPDVELWALERRITTTVLNVYAIRMGAVFILSTTTIGVKTGILPRWLAVAGYVVAALLLFGIGITAWVNLLLPAWVLVLSVDILLTNARGQLPGSDDAIS